jgi:hypothetical protein
MNYSSSSSSSRLLFDYLSFVLYVSPGEIFFPAVAFMQNYFTNGPSYPVGGASEFAFNMIPVIERAGA